MLTSAEVLRYTALATFLPFSKNDWDAFSGVDVPDPLIGEYGSYILIIAGNVVTVVDTEGQEEQFLLGSQ